MPRQIPEEIVKKYVLLDSKIAQLSEERSKLKERLRHYNEQGYESPLLRFQESTTWKPDWKKLVHELTAKYMAPPQRRVYFSKLLKRFPRKEVAPTIVILSEEQESKRGKNVSARGLRQ